MLWIVNIVKKRSERELLMKRGKGSLLAAPDEKGTLGVCCRMRQKNRTGAGKEEKREPVPGYIYFMALFAILLPGMLLSFANQIPTFGVSIGYTLETSAMLTSFCMIGNVGGKLLMGAISDRIGIYRSAVLFLIMVLISMLLFLFAQGSLPAMLAAAILFGAEYALYMNVQPILFIDIYGPREYQMKISRNQAILSLSGAVMSVLIPYIYDFTGSFNPYFILGLILCSIALVLYVSLGRRSRRLAGK